ncbi:alpha/beta fold hydrolase [Marinimicrobium sp. ABcell2]|uniref:alpha/beta fold hydrolase n=1 Tax=Marinimicrobium sp. ABcell2 TaxID=3069751 RepID=UPI0027AF1924|nr:alpha/beta hydrolase [Marinimicrobium sp. ABcell2]MDQ2075825.1 alpha/beta hydrolase [Marinimicrobium sp. ABcell2]
MTIYVILAGVLTAFYLRGSAVLDGNEEMDGGVSETIKLDINGAEQFLIIRGRDITKPVMLFLHGGPGTPEAPFIHRWNPDIDHHVVLVLWEQRGAGKSFSSGIDPATMTVDQFIEDAHQVTQYLKSRFGRDKVLLAGHSWGTYLGIRLIEQFPADYSAYIGISQTVHATREARIIYSWVQRRATEAGSRKALQALEDIHLSEEGVPLSDLSILLKWVNRYGGAAFYGRSDSYRRLVWAVLTYGDYSLRDKINYPRGESFTLKYLYEEIANIDLIDEVKTVDVPVFFAHGRHDYQVPMAVAQDYFAALHAPYKEFHIFDNSAHGVLIEEPEKFNSLLAQIVRKVEGGELTQ